VTAPRLVRFSIDLPEDAPQYPGWGSPVTFSPDGTTLIYQAAPMVVGVHWIR
jgi:hypothetical protein